MSKGQRTYVYLAALVSGLALLFSAVVLSNWASGQWAAGALYPLPAGVLAQPPLTPWLWIGVVALVLWLIHATFAARSARQETAEGLANRYSSQRKAYLYLMQLGALGVCLVEGQRLVSDLLARFMRQPNSDAAAGSGTILGAGIGLVIGFAAWAFFRRRTLRDGDYGHEEGRAAIWRRLYFYLALGLGLALTVYGAAQLLRVMLGLGGELVLGRLPTPAASRATVVSALTAMALGLPLMVLAWHGINQTIDMVPQAEINAPSRILFLRAIAFFATATTLLSLTYVLWQLFMVTFGQRVGVDYILPGDALTTALAITPVAVALWLAAAGALQNDAALGDESRGAAIFRRAHFYVIVAACLAGFWYGATQLLRAIFPLALDAFSSADVVAPVSVVQLGLTAALLLVAAPAWWGHWWPLQVRANRFTADGFEERASVLRRGYLAVVIIVASALILVALGMIVFTLVGGRPANATDGSTLLMSSALAVGLVAVGWWALHVLTLRSDRLAQATWLRVQASLPGPVEFVIPADGSRSFAREELTPLAPASPEMDATAAVPAAPVIVVVDGADGALGVSIMEALRAALPGVIVAPHGLTVPARQAMQDDAANASALPDALKWAAVIIMASDDLPARGEGVSPDYELQSALESGRAQVLLLPPRRAHYRWVGAPDWPMERWIQYVVSEAARALQTGA